MYQWWCEAGGGVEGLDRAVLGIGPEEDLRLGRLVASGAPGRAFQRAANEAVYEKNVIAG